MRPTSALASALLFALAGLAAGCSSGPAETQAPPPTPALDRAATDARAMFDGMTPQQRDAARTASRPKPRPLVDLPPPVEAAPAPEPAAQPANTVAPSAHAPTKSPQERRAELVRDLAALIRPEGGGGASANLLAAMQLAALAAADPAARQRLRDAEAALPRNERAVLDALSTLLTAAGDPASKTDSDWARLLRDAAARLEEPQGLAIGRALLCRRVEAFGRFTSFDPVTFVAGKAQPVLVYVELQNFGYKAISQQANLGPVPPDRDDTQWEVAVSQQIEVRTDTGRLVAYEKESTTRDQSRNQRREFYLVQRVNLAATLAPGGYTLKVHVRDHSTGAEAEQVVPFTIVATADAVEHAGR